MMAITTSNSIRVNAFWEGFAGRLPGRAAWTSFLIGVANCRIMKQDSLHAYAVEKRPVTRRALVCVIDKAGLADDVALECGEGGLRGQVRGALQEINLSAHALPGDGDSGNVRRWRT